MVTIQPEVIPCSRTERGGRRKSSLQSSFDHRSSRRILWERSIRLDIVSNLFAELLPLRVEVRMVEVQEDLALFDSP
jgi:hypothetical protein